MEVLNIQDVLNEMDFARELSKIQPVRHTIQNVDIIALIEIYNSLDKNKCIYMPGELDTETIVLIHMATPECVIYIESEQCVMFKSKTMQNFHFN